MKRIQFLAIVITIYAYCISIYVHYKRITMTCVNFLSNFNTKPHIILLRETKIKGKPLTNISLPGYSFLHNNSQTNAGGVGVYIYEQGVTTVRYGMIFHTIFL